jgi:hypothetical protein
MIYLILGSLVLILTFREVFHAVLVPRGELHTAQMAHPLVRIFLWPPYRYMACKFTSPTWQAEIFGLFAPLVIVFMLSFWVVLLIVGFGLILLAYPDQTAPPIGSLSTALYIAGSSVLTIGCSDYVGKTTGVRYLMLASAFGGLIITASVISLLFSLIGSVQRREGLVSVMSDIAGSPPSGIAILETYAQHKAHKALDDLYHNWHLWCADVSLSHQAYPILPYFRSTDAFTSWLTALGAALDSAALFLSTNPKENCLSAKLMLHSAVSLMNEFTTVWKLDPSKDSSVSDEELEKIYLRLQKAGYLTSNDQDAERTFLQLRQQYNFAHRALCDYLAVPQTPFSTEHQLSISVAQTEHKL